MSIINKANTKKELLRLSEHHRNGKFTRVSGKLLDHIEMQQKQLLIDIVRRHPSLGQTLTI